MSRPGARQTRAPASIGAVCGSGSKTAKTLGINQLITDGYLTLHDGCRAWKSVDWEATNRLHEKGLIEVPPNKAKSVVFTEQGLKEAERLFKELFAKK